MTEYEAIRISRYSISFEAENDEEAKRIVESGELDDDEGCLDGSDYEDTISELETGRVIELNNEKVVQE